MATIRLVPSTYAVSNSSYVSVSDASNMYTNTDSTSYGTITHNRASTSNTYYAYIRGFNFGDVPLNATVNSFTVKIKAEATGHTTSTSSSYYMSLINGTTQIGSTSASGRLTTTTTTFTFANGSLTWSQIVGYGSNFGIRIPLRRQSTNTADVVSVYGAEIEVNYTPPVSSTHTVTLSTNETDIAILGLNNYTSGTWQNSATIDDGGWFRILIQGNLNDIVVTDNNIDVTSSLIYNDDDGEKIYDQYNYEKYNVHEDHDVVVSHSSPQTLYTITTVYDSDFTGSTSADDTGNKVGAGRGVLVGIQGNDYTDLYVTDNGVNVTSSLIYVPEEEISGITLPDYYYFTILNVQSNHTIVITRGTAPSQSIYLKANGNWLQTTKVYKKSNNTWVEQSDYSSLFSNNDIWIKV